MGQSHPLNDLEKALQSLNDPAHLANLDRLNEVIDANQLQPHELVTLNNAYLAMAHINKIGPSEIGGENELDMQGYNELKAQIDADIIPLQHRQREAQRATEEKKRLEDNENLMRTLILTGTPRTNVPATTYIPAKSSTPPDETESMSLTDRQVLILIEMHTVDCTIERKKWTQADIVSRCQPNANPDTWKRDFSYLKSLQLVDSKTGAGGGCWLTPKGKVLAVKLKNN